MHAEPLTEEQLLAAVKNESETSIGFWTDDISSEQETNLRRYLGLPYGDEVTGRSSVVSHDCAQVVDWALPDIIEPFAGGTDIVTFQPNSEKEIPQARQASDYLNNLYYQQNSGFMNMYTVLKDGFIQKVGVSKVVWVTDEKVITEELFGLSEAQLGDISDDELIEIIEMVPGEERPPPVPLEGLPQPVVDTPAEFTVDITFKRRQRGKATVIAFPPEEFRISARSASLNDARYKAHVSELTKGALIGMGFDKKDVESLPASGDEVDLEIRKDTRFSDESDSNPEPSDTPMSDTVLLHEEYITIDMNGDGDEEMMQVFRVGNTILEFGEIDDHPFVAFCPEMIPHKFFGQALVDKAKETQRVKTVLTRQMLDNVYLANNPQREVPDEAVGDHTISDLLTYRFGGLVRTRRPNMIREIPIADRSATALAAIQYMDTVKELDSGITRNSSVPINVDREKTAAEIHKVDRGESARKRLIARVFAETYLVPMFEKLLKLTVKYQDYISIIEVRGKWIEMDPKYWNANMKAGIQIGLGYLEKQDMLAAAQQILAMQIQGLDQGMAGPKELWNTADIIVQTSGLQFTNRFFKRPEEVPEQKPKPSPEELRQQTEMAKIESMTRVKMAEAELENQIDQLKEQNKQAIATQDVQFDFQVELKRLEDNFRAKLRQQDLEAQLALREQNLEAGLKVREHANAASLNGGGVRFGGTIG